jgi:6,7-dimethyl-8-ribityllumazine synthase
MSAAALLPVALLMKTVEGSPVAKPGLKICLVAARFNSLVVEPLVSAARDALCRHGVNDDDITLVRVPGAWEIPWACRQVASGGKVDAIVALGAVVRGSTPHFDYVAGEVAKGVAQVSLATGLVVTFGVLTTDTLEQALDRAGGKAGNKGADAALAALEMVSLRAALG